MVDAASVRVILAGTDAADAALAAVAAQGRTQVRFKLGVSLSAEAH